VPILAENNGLGYLIGILAPQTIFVTIILFIYFLSRLFILGGCDMKKML
jgi:hypothetical protein